MTLILEYRDKIKKFYRLNAVVILPILRFMLAFFALNGVNTMMGYMPRLDNIAIVLIASLACSFLPAGFLVLLCTLFSLGHLYSLSLEALVIGVCVYLLLFLMMLRFAPRDSYVVILTPLLFALKMPYVIPVAVGLVGSPLSAISVACGVLLFYFLNTMVSSAPTLSSMGEKEYLDKIRFLIDAVMKNKPALVIAGAFAMTVIIVYLVRRLSVEHAWTIAIVAGAMINLVLLLIGDLMYSINLSMGSAIFGSILAVLVGMVIQFFRFCVDYGRTEWVQFEDDDYYYYVKAVPKMNIATGTKTVKRINTNTQSLAPVGERIKGSGTGRSQTQISSRSEQGSRSGRSDQGSRMERPDRSEQAGRMDRMGRSDQERRIRNDQEFDQGGETRALPPVRVSRTVRSDGRGHIPLGEDDGSDGSRYTRPGSGMTSGGGSYGGGHRPAKTNKDDEDGTDDYEELF